MHFIILTMNVFNYHIWHWGQDFLPKYAGNVKEPEKMSYRQKLEIF